jgi:hypothetical protein
MQLLSRKRHHPPRNLDPFLPLKQLFINKPSTTAPKPAVLNCPLPTSRVQLSETFSANLYKRNKTSTLMPRLSVTTIKLPNHFQEKLTVLHKVDSPSQSQSSKNVSCKVKSDCTVGKPLSQSRSKVNQQPAQSPTSDSISYDSSSDASSMVCFSSQSCSEQADAPSKPFHVIAQPAAHGAFIYLVLKETPSSFTMPILHIAKHSYIVHRSIKVTQPL